MHIYIYIYDRKTIMNTLKPSHEYAINERKRMSIKRKTGTQKKGKKLTCFTMQTAEARCTLAQVTIDLIYTGTAVLTGVTGTLVYV